MRAMSAKKAMLAVGLVLAIWFACLLLPCMERRESPAVRIQSGYNIKHIALAIRGYHDVYKKMPPAVVRDRNGQPLYGWRVAILPWLQRADLYNRLKLDEPWDSPHNKNLAAETPPCYTDPGATDPPGTTRYQAFVGPGTAFEREGLMLKDFPDGASQTILIVEAATPVPWAKPVDLVYDPKAPLPSLGVGFTKPRMFLCYETSRTPAFHAGFADGSLRFLRSTIPESTLRALITRNGGEAIDWSELD